MIISVVKRKGGVGASLVSLLLYHSLKQAGRSVELRDWDAQGTATKSRHLTESSIYASAPDILICDTPPSLTHTATETAIRTSDLILVIATPSPVDVWEVQETVALAQKHKRPEAKVRVIWNKVKRTTVLGRMIEQTAKQFAAPVLPTTLAYRESYQHFAWQGWLALDAPAREEVLQLTIAVLGAAST